MRQKGWLLLVVLCGLLGLAVGCGDEDTQCTDMIEALKQTLRATNPGLDKPTRKYGPSEFEDMKKIQLAGCELKGAYLGSAPLKCNPGVPKCPPNYTCDGNSNCSYP